VTRVLVVSDDGAVRAALSRHPGITVVDSDPDVIVVDAGERGLAALPPGGGAPVGVPPGVPIVALGTGAGALRAWARGVLPRESGVEEIAAAVQAVAAGLLVLHPELAAPVEPTRADGGAGVAAAGTPLTPRERQVLSMLADGLGNKTIAARLGISDHTVKAHVAAIFEKLAVSTRAEAAALGLRRGLIAL
jgi:DNA-binding CsgD family transcriptional regulator